MISVFGPYAVKARLVAIQNGKLASGSEKKPVIQRKNDPTVQTQPDDPQPAGDDRPTIKRKN
jgi:hypothetical protein